MSDTSFVTDSSFEDQPFEELPLAELGIEELESRVQLSLGNPEVDVEVVVGISW